MVYRFNYCISFPYTQCSRLNGSGNCGRRAGGLDSVCTGMREMSSQPHTCLAWRPWTTETNQKRQGWWENGEKRVWPLFQRWPQNISAGKWLIAGKRNKRKVFGCFDSYGLLVYPQMPRLFVEKTKCNYEYLQRLITTS